MKFCLSAQVSDQTDDNKNTSEESYETEIIHGTCFENIVEETSLIRRKSLRTEERKFLPIEDSVPEPIEEEETDENWIDKTFASTTYKELVRLIEDHVIRPFDGDEWANESVEATWFARKETTV